MGSIGFPEMMGIMVIALIIFGPKKLPQIGRSLGAALRELRKASQELTNSINASLEDEPATYDSKEGDKDVRTT